MKHFKLNLEILKPDDIVIHYFINDVEILKHSTGNFITRRNKMGSHVLVLEEGNAFLNGAGYSEKGQFGRPPQEAQVL